MKQLTGDVSLKKKKLKKIKETCNRQVIEHWKSGLLVSNTDSYQEHFNELG